MKELVFLFEAEQEMYAAVHFYNIQEDGLGLDFLDEVQVALDRIRKAPGRWRVIFQDIRKIIVKRFPFNIIYRVEPDQIIILAVAHQKRKWDYWQTRL